MLAETFDYKIGYRSAREWVIEEYQITKDKRREIINNPSVLVID
jgi:predicted helicase